MSLIIRIFRKRIFWLLVGFSFSLSGQNLGRGINLGNMFEAPSEAAWGNPYKEAYIGQIADLGFQHVRVPIRWDVAERTQLTPPYTVNPQFLARIKSVVDLAISKHLYVIINMHHHEELFTNPAASKARFISQWQQIATYFKGYDNHLYFEVLNEPHDALTPELWNAYFAEALAEIRKTNPYRKVLLGTASYGGPAGVRDLNPPKDSNLILSVHYYSPFNFTHQGADWAGNKDKYIGTKWEDLAWERDQIIADFDYVIQWAKQHNMPLHVGEFGSYELADIDSRARWTTFIARWLEAQGASWAYWEYSAGFGIYNPLTNTYKTPLVDALLKNPMPAAKVLPTKNLFSLNGQAGWNVNLNSGASANLATVPQGLQVVLSKVTGTGWHIQLTRSGFPLSYKKRYVVKIKAQADKPISITSYLGRSSSPYNAYSSYNNLSIEPNEKEFVFVFTMGEPYDANARMVFDMGTALATVQINAIQVDEVIEEVPLGVEEPKFVNAVFPNPFNDVLQVQGTGERFLRLIDVRGKIIFHQAIQGNQTLDVSQLPAGIYGLQLKAENETFESFKLLKE
ncbi:cellulase family glycosylhydrolase [Aquirufa sp. LEPPI-3A]|uniref:cellulase family glycosylhydrolase n=1 Tax=Aquirufa regiilacus TaxID=3024868 RepID=UPI0028DE8BF2|nr:cellulase family glycosylhydrolase [Aquirufa sp. LEPPI-3A]MDT8886211.1 cellulase family glycosylhydrolase [Aquirufa sp. LEPPI-3A]